jgi:septum formation protein
LSADTIVVLNGEILGKPVDEAEAVKFLKSLSATRHEVITGICLVDVSGKTIVESETTQVEFRALSDKEISEYVATGEPMDKAGAYGIQGGGGKFVKGYVGSISNVVGLPIEKLQQVLKENGWDQLD